MKPPRPLLIESDNLSTAWASCFLAVLEAPHGKSPPLVLGLSGFLDRKPTEDLDFRKRVDRALTRYDKIPIIENAYTIFPYGTWKRRERPTRQQLFDRYLQIYPRLQARDKSHRYGTYFQRMISYSGVKADKTTEINQLDHILRIWERDTAGGRYTRRSALQVSCFDPAKDHTGQPVRGFPCLQQVSFSWDKSDGLTVSAYYPTQYIFDRGYGNYLGLCQLGEFMAQEMALDLVRLNCFVSLPMLGDVTKSSLQDLKKASIALLAMRQESPVGEVA